MRHVLLALALLPLGGCFWRQSADNLQATADAIAGVEAIERIAAEETDETGALPPFSTSKVRVVAAGTRDLLQPVAEHVADGDPVPPPTVAVEQIIQAPEVFRGAARVQAAAASRENSSNQMWRTYMKSLGNVLSGGGGPIDWVTLGLTIVGLATGTGGAGVAVKRMFSRRIEHAVDYGRAAEELIKNMAPPEVQQAWKIKRADLISSQEAAGVQQTLAKVVEEKKKPRRALDPTQIK